MSENWKSHTVFKTFPLSEKSMKVLECLHNDLYKCYHNAFVKHEDGTEDRAAPPLIRELLVVILTFPASSDLIISSSSPV